MPQMEKFGKASATTTVTSAPGSSSRARSAALIPASLPPIITRCMTGSLWLARRWAGWARRPGRCGGAIVGGPGGRGPGLILLVRDDDVSGLGRGDAGIQRADDHHGQGAANDLGSDEA